MPRNDSSAPLQSVAIQALVDERMAKLATMYNPPDPRLRWCYGCDKKKDPKGGLIRGTLFKCADCRQPPTDS